MRLENIKRRHKNKVWVVNSTSIGSNVNEIPQILCLSGRRNDNEQKLAGFYALKLVKLKINITTIWPAAATLMLQCTSFINIEWV